MNIDLTANCISHYKMNDNAASKIVVDSQGFSNGTAQRNTSLLTTTGKVGGALNFNKTIPDGINLNDGFLTVLQSDFSIAMLVKPNDGRPSGVQNFIVKEELTGDVYMKLNANGSIEADYGIYGVGDLLYTSDVIFNDGVEDWHFLVMTVEQLTPTTGKLSFYLDGQFKGYASGDMVMTSFANANDMYLGILGMSNPFDGLLDNVMIFNKALSTDEIAFLYNGGRGTEDLEGELPERIETAITSAIENDTTLAALIGDRVYFAEAPQKAALPFIVYEQLGTEFFKTLQGTIPLRKPSFQFYVYAADMATVKAISEALKNCLNALSGVYGNVRIERAKPTNEGDLADYQADEKLKRRGRQITYDIWLQKV